MPRTTPGTDVQPLERAHAHNDYEHDRPLLDALDHGFTSVEADVWLVGTGLCIGHDEPDPSRTLANTYLEPLAERVRANGGTVYPGRDRSFRLLIDVKTDGSASWPVVERELARFGALFTTYRPRAVRPGPVTAVISGNRDLAAMQAAPERRSCYDGTVADLGRGLPSDLVAMISDNWSDHFGWRGEGAMPAAEQQRLHAIVATAHRAGCAVRFWGVPDDPGPSRDALWSELVAAGVDAVNTDRLADLRAFLLAADRPG